MWLASSSARISAAAAKSHLLCGACLGTRQSVDQHRQPASGDAWSQGNMNFQGARLAIFGCPLGNSDNPTLKASTEQLRLAQHTDGLIQCPHLCSSSQITPSVRSLLGHSPKRWPTAACRVY